MIESGHFSDKKILLVDKSDKRSNDRTWCFWEKENGLFEPVVHKRWNYITVYNNQFHRRLDTNPYTYKMIRGIDFYKHCLSKINQQPNIDWMYGQIDGVVDNNGNVQLIIDGQMHDANKAVIFNSVRNESSVQQQKAIRLLQHFKGWMIETPIPSFNPEEAVLMDFRMPQSGGTTFGYTLPLTTHRALVEYTLFSESLLEDNAYDEGLKRYIEQNLGITTYTITEQEKGVIPMTNEVFPWYEGGAYHIGTAGGQTKASSGYTFQFIQKQTAAIVQALVNNKLNKNVKPFPSPRRFHFYDSVLLHILAHKKMGGDDIFTRLFKKNTAPAVFKFLDNESSLPEDLALIKSLPTGVFLRAALATIMA